MDSKTPDNIDKPRSGNVFTPNPVNVVTPNPVNVVTPNPVNVVTPNPVTVVPPNLCNVFTPNPVNVVTPNPVNVVTPKPALLNRQQSHTGSSASNQPFNYQETVTGTYHGADFVYTHSEYTPGAPDLNSIQNAAPPVSSDNHGGGVLSTFAGALKSFGAAAASRLSSRPFSSASNQVRWAVIISVAGVDRAGAAIKDTQTMEFSSLENAQKYAQTVNEPRLRNNQELYHVEIIGPYNKASPEQTGSSQTVKDPSASSRPELKPRKPYSDDGLD